jgi:peroxiredoxin
VILGVNTTYQDDGEAALRFAGERGVQFPVVFDMDGAVSRRYQIQALPTTFFIDRKGIIRQVIYGGPLNEGLLKVEVQKLLEEGN